MDLKGCKPQLKFKYTNKHTHAQQKKMTQPSKLSLARTHTHTHTHTQTQTNKQTQTVSVGGLYCLIFDDNVDDHLHYVILIFLAYTTYDMYLILKFYVARGSPWDMVSIQSVKIRL